MSSSSGYQPKPTPALPTGATSIEPHSTRAPRVDGVRQGFEATFGAYVPPDWTLDAECTRPGTDPNAFYPTKGGRQKDQLALSVCATCLVRKTCLEDAIEYETGVVGAEEIRPEVHGVRGGMTQKERRRLIQRRKVEAAEAVKKAVLKDYRTSKLTVEQIAEKHDVAKSSVSRWAQAGGVSMRPRQGGRRARGVA